MHREALLWQVVEQRGSADASARTRRRLTADALPFRVQTRRFAFLPCTPGGRAAPLSQILVHRLAHVQRDTRLGRQKNTKRILIRTRSSEEPARTAQPCTKSSDTTSNCDRIACLTGVGGSRRCELLLVRIGCVAQRHRGRVVCFINDMLRSSSKAMAC